ASHTGFPHYRRRVGRWRFSMAASSPWTYEFGPSASSADVIQTAHEWCPALGQLMSSWLSEIPAGCALNLRLKVPGPALRSAIAQPSPRPQGVRRSRFPFRSVQDSAVEPACYWIFATLRRRLQPRVTSAYEHWVGSEGLRLRGCDDAERLGEVVK